MASNTKGQGAIYRWICDHVDYQNDDCLIWPFGANQTGYPYFGHEGGHYRAHRFMCALAHGEPPTLKHQAAHSCGNGRKGCVNPRHLSWKTNGENQIDRRRHGTKNISKGYGRGAGKISPEQNAEIRRLYEAGTTQTALADKFGVTHSTIQYQLYGGSYKPRRQLLGAK